MTKYLNETKIDDLCNEIGQETFPVLLDIFLGELNEYQVELAEDKSELEVRLGDISHALKSSAASFGAENLCQIATGIDAQVKAGRKINTSENRQSMMSSLEKTISAYDSLFD
ncbi:phosphorelay protein LuxU [Vibrio sp. MACH09]|uniref:Hpt domain-containing protein n=1 Tax=unclassified Vibrio TaxID=2614977 RepID=UPI0014937F5B|nr:Hpt domain-containing protein [Vibrio sp. MACH09]NOI68486.1 Hpt domain-containing protein [Vibrio sp. 99-8-1]GLO61419.1 phosphorelay protein LuxU [Vibrio sp. MACH09]